MTPARRAISAGQKWTASNEKAYAPPKYAPWFRSDV